MKKTRCGRTWQPALNVTTGFPVVLTLALILCLLSFFTLISTFKVYEKEIDYTDCFSTKNPSVRCRDAIRSPGQICVCRVFFDLRNRTVPSLHVYLQIEGMFQNHRIYAESFDLEQHLGGILSESPSSACKHLRVLNTKPIVPCGSIANSILNDTVVMTLDGGPITLSTLGMITLPEKKIYRNPPGESIAIAFQDTAKPPNWAVPLQLLDPKNAANNGFLNSDLINWMRIYPFPNVLKLKGRVGDPSGPLKPGIYEAYITYNYPVTVFFGRKKILLSQVTWLGRSKNAIGYIYCAASILCVIFAIFFGVSSYRSISDNTLNSFMQNKL